MKRLSQPLTDPAFVQDPYKFYDRARSAGPVIYWDEMGMPAVFGHAAVNALLRHRRLGRTPLTPRPAPPHLAAFRALEADSLLELEPPRHTRLRNLVLRAFTSRRIRRLAPDIAEIARTLVQDLPRNDAFDLIPAFCQPLPVRIIARLLGVPEDLAPQLLRWSSDMVAMYQAGVTHETETRAGAAAQAFASFMRSYIDTRRTAPANDLITHLILAEENGNRLTTDEMVSTCILLLNAGHEATVHTLGNAVRVLLETGVVPTRDTAAAITEEVLRFDAPLHVFTRYASAPVDLPGGAQLARGQEVALVLGAANRDPAVFAQPHRFDPGRDNPKHASFGAGLHFCVGAALARLEIATALPIVFAALPDLSLAERPQYALTYHFHKHDRLLVRA